MAKAHIRFNDDIEHYEPSDSETEYTEREKDMLKKVRTKRKTQSDSEEEVYGLPQESSDDSDIAESDSDIAESDIEGQEDDNLPDSRAWGQRKRAFYSTDYVDPDYGGYQGKDAISADIEEQEARTIQQRLAEQLDDDDFTLDIFNRKPESELNENEEEIIKTDLSSLSKRQILELLRKESPEFFELIEDYKEKMKTIKEYLAPIIELDKKGLVPPCKALEFVKTHYHLILNYCTNIYMYLLLKASRVNVQSHPVIKRLYQYRQLIAQLEPAYVEIVKPQLEVIIEGNRDKPDDTENIVVKINKKKTKKLKLLEGLDNVDKKLKNNEENASENLSKSKKLKKDVKSILKTDKTSESKNVSFENRNTDEEPKNSKKIVKDSDSESDEEHDEKVEENEEATEQTEETKRAITYQMAKNKGLTPHRKKELRNPRVKHRNKFRKAQIRRKGAVREVRKELSRYAGEISGIKTSVSKSVKIK